jgi:hypothetical protein
VYCRQRGDSGKQYPGSWGRSADLGGATSKVNVLPGGEQVVPGNAAELRTSSTADRTAARMAQARSSSALEGRHARLPSALMAIQKAAAARPSMVHRVRGITPLFICTLSDSPGHQTVVLSWHLQAQVYDPHATVRRQRHHAIHRHYVLFQTGKRIDRVALIWVQDMPARPWRHIHVP